MLRFVRLLCVAVLLSGILYAQDSSSTIGTGGTPKPAIGQDAQRSAEFSEFLRQLADPDVAYVRCPAGEWCVSKSILVQRSNVVVDFDGATIVPVDGLFMPLRVVGELEGKEWHATGVVGSGTRGLSLDPAESFPVAVGDVHRVGIGVNFSDPNESQYVAIRRVVAVDNGIVQYDRPFGIAAQQFESFERLSQLSGYPEKVGPWGPGSVYGSQQLRGLGTDHGIRAIRKPADRVTILRPRIVWPEGSRLYGTWGVNLAFCRDCIVLDAEVVNPCGSAVHLWWCENCVVTGLKLSGDGGGNPWIHKVPPGVTDAANAVSAWGAVDARISRVAIRSTNTSLLNFEAGCRGIEIRNCDIATTWAQGVRTAPQFGIYGPGSVSVESITIDNEVRSSSMWPGWLADTTFRDLRFVRPQLPDWISWSNSGKHIGPLQWGEHRFGSIETVEFSFTPDRDGFSIPYPEGVVKSAEFQVADWTGVRAVNVKNNYTGTAASTVVPDVGSYQLRVGDTYQQYRQQLAGHRVWIVRGATVQPIKVKCQIMKAIQ